MIADRDWSSVSGDTSNIFFKSFIYNITSAPGADNILTLFVPFEQGANTVGICPNIRNFDEISENCAGLVFLNATSPGVSIVEIDSISYWKIENLRDAGGFNLFREDLPIDDVLGKTGDNLFYPIGITASMLHIIIFLKKHLKFCK